MEAFCLDNGQDHVAIVRLEQLYPLPIKQLEVIIQSYSNAQTWCWVQEEPANMGAWDLMMKNFTFTPAPLHLVSRQTSSSPASGFARKHQKEQNELIGRAFSTG